MLCREAVRQKSFLRDTKVYEVIQVQQSTAFAYISEKNENAKCNSTNANLLQFCSLLKFFTTDFSRKTYAGNLEEKNTVRLNEVHFVELEVLAKLESTKGKDNDGFRNEVLKKLSIGLGNNCFVFNINCKKHVFPAVWKTGKIVPIYKDGDKQSIDR